MQWGKTGDSKGAGVNVEKGLETSMYGVEEERGEEWAVTMVPEAEATWYANNGATARRTRQDKYENMKSKSNSNASSSRGS